MPPDSEDLDEVLYMISDLSLYQTAKQMTTEEAKYSGEESREKLESHEHLTLEALPNEIISSIAGMLAIGAHVPYEVPRYDSAPYRACCGGKDANARRDLTNLCMVSKRMASNSEKALYRRVIITHANTMILLYRTFLENPQLGAYVKRISINIDHGDFSEWYAPQHGPGDWKVVNDSPIVLSSLLSFAHHGLGEHLPKPVRKRRRAPRNIPVDIFFTLQFRLLGHASNLESLDINVHPILPLVKTYTSQNMEKRDWEETGAVLCSLWEEILPRLSRVKNLQMIGNHEPLEIRKTPVARQLFSAQIWRCFLKLPNLKQLVWANYSKYWFSTLPFLMVSGIDIESRFESVRILVLEESPCLPQGLHTICSAFPNLESLSVGNGHGSPDEYPEDAWAPYRPHANGDLTQDTGGRSLTDSLGTLKNLKTLSLDLHHYHEISGTLGPAGTLSLAGLPKLETLEMPFHFFARSVLPEGYHQLVSPEGILPPSLKVLKIITCNHCDDFEPYHSPGPFDAAHRYWAPPGEHGDAVVELLHSLAVVRNEYIPILKQICYEELEVEDYRFYRECPVCERDFHLNSGRADASSLMEDIPMFGNMKMLVAKLGQWRSNMGQHGASMLDVRLGSVKRNRRHQGGRPQAGQGFLKDANRGMMNRFIEALMARKGWKRPRRL